MSNKLRHFFSLFQIIAECSELQQELCSFRTERDELYKETLQQRALLDALEDDKKKLEQDLDWMAKKGCGHETTVSRGHKEEKAPPTAKVGYWGMSDL